MPKRLAGVVLKRAIVRSKFLPDHPEPFRKQMVEKALQQEGIEVAKTTLDNALLSLLSQGYLVRSKEQENAASYQPFHLWMFAHADRTSERPGYQTGDPADLWRET